MDPRQPAVTVHSDAPGRPTPPPRPWRRTVRLLIEILASAIVGLLVGTLGEIVSGGPAGG
ncbi:hypothetical protein JIG36_05665 [Actinoplanes sp. LDG1-06]|uniref:Uncharacterized protein n=1 Tax=Paractinoplanes ovalisporus TaxID=2810368 RepID=A0ABS2A5D2_9ACTN|nr:hypothetical protein [Actinoplanes ovalisporus]MBM2615046.1 hypothetical protein [Actinoplanes ovalisporus]